MTASAYTAQPSSPSTLSAVNPMPEPPEIDPRCPHFGPCGGCQLQHLRDTTQIAGKQHRLAALLTAAGITDRPVLQTHVAKPWQYRNRIRVRVEPAATSPGTFLPGYNRRASIAFLPVTTCPIAAPLLLRTAQALAALALDSTSHARWLAAAAELDLFTTPDESCLQLTVLLRNTPGIPAPQHARSFADLCVALQQRIPQLAGAGAVLLRSTRANSSTPRATRRSAAAFAPPVWGSPGLPYPVTRAGRTEQLWVSRGSFFQVNRHLLETLLAIATANLPASAEAGSLAWDLFAGVGLFTRALTASFASVTAVETALSAVADLASARLPNLRIVSTTVLDFLRSAATGRDRPNLVLLDPPRAGLGLEAARLLTRLCPARIVYVSCEPETLARDLRPMLSSGYNLAELHLVDMFPQTSHLETVAILTRDATMPQSLGAHTS